MSEHGRYLGVEDGRSRTGPIPARRPVDDALDRLLAIVEAAETQGRWILSGRDVINITQAAITVREALERQREERDYAREGWNEALAGHQACGESLLECSAKREAAEAEARQLREERDVWVASHIEKDKELWMDADEIGKLERSIQYERDQVRRLTEGLRAISAEASRGIRAENRLPFLTHIGVIAETTLAGDPERHARALLSASPSDGGGAK